MKKIQFTITGIICSLMLIAFVSTVTIGCSKNRKTDPKSTAQQFLEGLYHLDFPAAKAVATKETQAQLERFSQRRQEDFKKQAMAIRVMIQEPVIDGDKATVDYNLSNDATVRTLKMIRKDGQWLAEWSKMDFGGATMIDMVKGKSETPPAETEPDVPADSTVNPTPGTDTVR